MGERGGATLCAMASHSLGPGRGRMPGPRLSAEPQGWRRPPAHSHPWSWPRGKTYQTWGARAALSACSQPVPSGPGGAGGSPRARVTGFQGLHSQSIQKITFCFEKTIYYNRHEKDTSMPIPPPGSCPAGRHSPAHLGAPEPLLPCRLKSMDGCLQS